MCVGPIVFCIHFFQATQALAAPGEPCTMKKMTLSAAEEAPKPSISEEILQSMDERR